MSCGKAIERTKSSPALPRTTLQLHKYSIDMQHVLGSGSYSVVRRAHDSVNGTPYACKQVCHQSRAALNCVNRELTALQTLPPHPNIVQLCHVHRDSEYAYLFLTSPRGAVTLRNYLDEHVTRGAQLTDRAFRVIMRQLIEAVQHCHNRGVAHRDLKLENVLIVPHSLHVTLIDFGLALTDHVTHVNEALGSPLYMSPELLSARPHCARSADMWALGVIAHQLLYQQWPYSADTLDELHWLVTTHPYSCPDTRSSTGTSPHSTTTHTTSITPLASLVQSLLVHSPTARLSAEQALHHPALQCTTPR
jgi:serine/threonine protein kinase